jgi:tetratricopeptide (TPR) repeat protein
MFGICLWVDGCHHMWHYHFGSCRLRGDVKCWLNDYQGALEDLTKSDLLKPNDTFTLRALGAAKSALGDHRGALESLNSADLLHPNDNWTLR